MSSDLSPKLNYKEFVVFLLIYAAHADVEFHEDEQAFIIAKSSQETFDKMKALFDDMTDIQVLETIRAYKGIYFPTVEQKQELIDAIIELFKADGEYSSMEKTMTLFLDHLL